VSSRGLCESLTRPDAAGKRLSSVDVTTSFVDGNDLLARVNRSAAGSLPPDFAPDDLVDLRTGAASDARHCDPPSGQCLRREAASALHDLFAAMHEAIGDGGDVHSAFRAYNDQCGVFAKWAYLEGQGLCVATEQSALAGHSQHQLGTAIDVFTHSWRSGGDVFRSGFGCTAGGRWLDEHAWQFGYVLPYPLAPAFRAEGSRCATRPGIETTIDPRTGYRYEPWHIRYIGRDAAARFHGENEARIARGLEEVTLDEWLRADARVPGDIDLPVCDGCHCGACTTLADEGHGPCADRALRMAGEGRPIGNALPPRLDDAWIDGGGVIHARVAVPPGTVTQTSAGADLPGAYRVVLFSGDSTIATLPLTRESSIAVWQSVRAYLPAQSGTIELRASLGTPADANVLVALRRDGTTLEDRTAAAR
jgi:D-alanyl-D-alanine carboxypeptidase